MAKTKWSLCKPNVLATNAYIDRSMFYIVYDKYFQTIQKKGGDMGWYCILMSSIAFRFFLNYGGVWIVQGYGK